MTRQLILHEIDKERNYQQNKWGDASDDNVNTPWMWVSYISQYSTKWMFGSISLFKNDVDTFRTMMIKTAAICVAAVESIDRQRSKSGKTFYEN